MVVSDGSTDNTVEVAEKAGATVYCNPHNLGLAETFRVEMEKALEHDADIIIHTDADGQYRADDIPKLIKPILEDNCDLVLGSRFAGHIERMPLIKKIGNRLFSRVISRITGVKISDGQTGFRAFKRSVVEKVEIISTHTYTQEQIITAIRRKFKVTEVPVHFAERRSGKSRLMSNPFSYAVKAWITLLRLERDYDPLGFFSVIGVSLVVIAVFLAVFSIVVMGEILDITVLVLFLVGMQIILFGFLADMLKR